MKLLNRYVKDKQEKLYRILLEADDKTLIMCCGGSNLPRWERTERLVNFTKAEQPQLDFNPQMGTEYAVASSRFNMIVDVLAVIGDKKTRSTTIDKAANEYKISRPTICKYINLYLTYDCKEALASKPIVMVRKSLTDTEKNIRWALNRFYYTTEKNSLVFAYKQMLKERYYQNGELNEEYPTFYKFRYYYRKHNKKSNEIISRYGTSYYRRNERPLLGEGVQQIARGVGTGMVDSTICDIYLLKLRT